MTFSGSGNMDFANRMQPNLERGVAAAMPVQRGEMDVKRILAALLLLACAVSAVPSAGAERLDEETLLSYYDGSVFFGDSIMQGFRRYRSARRQTDPDFLEGVEVVCTASISLYEGSRRSLQTNRFRYRGVDRTMYQITDIIKPRKVYVLLGLNDPVGIKIDKAIGWIRDIVRNMDQLAPGTQVCFFSLTPVTAAYCRSRNRPKYQEQVNEYNRRLEEVCTELGAEYIDIATAMKDEAGYLDNDLSSDKVCHLNDDGVAVWVQAMCDYAQQRYDAGLWTPGRVDGDAAADPAAADEAGADAEPQPGDTQDEVLVLENVQPDT